MEQRPVISKLIQKYLVKHKRCEDSLNDKDYFDKVYNEACKLTAYLCKLFNINPLGTVNYNGISVPTILCHADSYTYGLGSNHGDVNHWFPKFGKSMQTAREDVNKLIIEEEEDDDNMTQETFDQMMNNYLIRLAQQEPSSWSLNARQWCESNGIMNGDENGNRMYKKFVTREELAQVEYAIHNKNLK